MKHLCHYICLISYINILKSYDYLVSSFIHCYLLSVVFNNKIHAPVSFKIVKQEYGLMCTVKLQCTTRLSKYMKTWNGQHVFLYHPFKCSNDVIEHMR